MSTDLTFEANCYARWTTCGSVSLVIKCPLCTKEFEDPMGIPDDHMKNRFDEHMLWHARLGQPHEAVP